MKIGYLLSDTFPYHKLICSDAGPAVAEEYDWCICSHLNLLCSPFDAIVVDNRHHQPCELSTLRLQLKAARHRLILLRVNDPFLFHRSDPWYQFCASLLDQPNIHLLTPYEPTGIVGHWLAQYPSKQFVFAPFTYDQSAELTCDHAVRVRSLAVSGNQRRDLYPLRYGVQRASKFQISRSVLRLERLLHPGYPEKQVAPSHRIMGTSFVRWLSRFTAAFTDSTIYRIELLKYREIAYAGCAPVGDLPWSLFACPASAFLDYQSLFDLLRLRRSLNDPSSTEDVALAFRNFLRSERCRLNWRARVSAAIARLI